MVASSLSLSLENVFIFTLTCLTFCFSTKSFPLTSLPLWLPSAFWQIVSWFFFFASWLPRSRHAFLEFLLESSTLIFSVTASSRGFSLIGVPLLSAILGSAGNKQLPSKSRGKILKNSASYQNSQVLWWWKKIENWDIWDKQNQEKWKMTIVCVSNTGTWLVYPMKNLYIESRLVKRRSWRLNFLQICTLIRRLKSLTTLYTCKSWVDPEGSSLRVHGGSSSSSLERASALKDEKRHFDNVPDDKEHEWKIVSLKLHHLFLSPESLLWTCTHSSTFPLQVLQKCKMY